MSDEQKGTLTLTEFMEETFSPEFREEAAKEYLKAHIEGLHHFKKQLLEWAVSKADACRPLPTLKLPVDMEEWNNLIDFIQGNREEP